MRNVLLLLRISPHHFQPTDGGQRYLRVAPANPPFSSPPLVYAQTAAVVRNPYRILGVEDSADITEVKKAYRKLALQ